MIVVLYVIGTAVAVMAAILASVHLMSTTKYIRTRNGKREEFDSPPPP